MIAYILVALLFVVPIVVYKKVYFKSVSCIKVPSDGSDPVLISVRPVKRWLRSISLGNTVGQVHLGNNLYAIYIFSDSAASNFNGIQITDDIYIFQAGFLRKFKSIDLSSRCVSDVLAKFVK